MQQTGRSVDDILFRIKATQGTGKHDSRMRETQQGLSMTGPDINADYTNEGTVQVERGGKKHR